MVAVAHRIPAAEMGSWPGERVGTGGSAGPSASSCRRPSAAAPGCVVPVSP